MNKSDLVPATRPTFYFIGVTTGKSSIMKVFPEWAKQLGLGECQMKGIDCKWHDDPAVYREVVSFIKNDPLSLGSLVTTHKIDLLSAARDLFDALDPHAELLGEISCISKKEGKLWGHAKDPITSGLSLKAFVPADHFKKTGAEMCLLGAGGSSLALTAYIMQNMKQEEWPSRIHITNRSPHRLDEMKKIHAQINPGVSVEYHHCPEATDNDEVVNGLKPGSLVINATGLGKDAPGSPLTGAALFPMNGYGWDFNYRGELVFLDQLRARQKARNLHIEDGWTYFLHGWTRVIAEVFHIEIPVSGPAFDALSDTARNVR
jgi:shikimate 5-dehydrogenase